MFQQVSSARCSGHVACARCVEQHVAHLSKEQGYTGITGFRGVGEHFSMQSHKDKLFLLLYSRPFA